MARHRPESHKHSVMQQDTLSNTEVPLKAVQNCPSLLKGPSILLSCSALSAKVQYSPNQCSGVEEESVTPQLSPVSGGMVYSVLLPNP